MDMSYVVKGKYKGEEWKSEFFDDADELILPTVIELNKKGYKTQFSCSGHIWDEDGEKDKLYGTYLVFKNADDLPKPPKSFHYKTVPQDGYIGLYLNDKRERIHDSDSIEKVYKRLLDINYELLLWANSLEEVEE